MTYLAVASTKLRHNREIRNCRLEEMQMLVHKKFTNLRNKLVLLPVIILFRHHHNYDKESREGMRVQWEVLLLLRQLLKT